MKMTMRWIGLVLLLSLPALAQVPVQIVKVEPHSHTRCALADMASNEKDPWGSCLVIWYTNTSSQRITGIRFDVHFVSALKEVDPAVYAYENTVALKPGKGIAGIWHDGVLWHQYGDGMGAEVQVGRVMFADGTFWTPPPPAAVSTAAATEPSKPPDQPAAREVLLKTINAQFAKEGVAGYADISHDKLTVHSERASAVRFHMLLANDTFISRMKDAGISAFAYTNDADQNFLYDVKAGQVLTASPQTTDSK